MIFVMGCAGVRAINKVPGPNVRRHVEGLVVAATKVRQASSLSHKQWSFTVTSKPVNRRMVSCISRITTISMPMEPQSDPTLNSMDSCPALAISDWISGMFNAQKCSDQAGKGAPPASY